VPGGVAVGAVEATVAAASDELALGVTAAVAGPGYAVDARPIGAATPPSDVRRAPPALVVAVSGGLVASPAIARVDRAEFAGSIGRRGTPARLLAATRHARNTTTAATKARTGTSSQAVRRRLSRRPGSAPLFGTGA
jgi:hypothetical protein